MQAHLLRIWASVDVTILFITHDLDEAIYLSDRIVVLGRESRPHPRGHRGRQGPRPRHPDQFLSGHFLATKKRLEELIYNSEPAAKGKSAEHRNRLRTGSSL